MISDIVEERNRTPDWEPRQFEGSQWVVGSRQVPLPQALVAGCAASKRRRLIEFKMPSNVKQDILN
jgi:hypothetical protein